MVRDQIDEIYETALRALSPLRYSASITALLFCTLLPPRPYFYYARNLSLPVDSGFMLVCPIPFAPQFASPVKPPCLALYLIACMQAGCLISSGASPALDKAWWALPASV